MVNICMFHGDVRIIQSGLRVLTKSTWIIHLQLSIHLLTFRERVSLHQERAWRKISHLEKSERKQGGGKLRVVTSRHVHGSVQTVVLVLTYTLYCSWRPHNTDQQHHTVSDREVCSGGSKPGEELMQVFKIQNVTCTRAQTWLNLKLRRSCKHSVNHQVMWYNPGGLSLFLVPVYSSGFD